MEIKTKCCGKEMYKDGQYINGEDITNFVCLKCGNFKHLATSQLDDEQLEGYREIADVRK